MGIIHLSGPIRTCVGCRRRDTRSSLLRVVSGGNAVVIDQRACLPGRGAWVHPNLECVNLAERRRAFSRALRVAGSLDLADLRTQLDRRSGPPSGLVVTDLEPPGQADKGSGLTKPMAAR